MAKMTRRNWLTAAGATTAALGVAGLTETNSLFGQEATPVSKQRYSFKDTHPRELIRRRKLPNVELMTQDGKKVRFYDDLMKDKRVVIQFMFTRCKDICPVITHNLVQVQRLLNGRVGSDIFFYSISLSPEEDTPRDLKAFAKKHGAGPGWTFLTGKPEDIFHLRKSLGYFYNNPKEDADRNNHSGMITMGTEPLMRWASCPGGAKPKWIATQIRMEMDAPLQGSVDGVTQLDPAIRLKSMPQSPGSESNGDHVHGHMRQ
jgi:protein SCO1/2